MIFEKVCECVAGYCYKGECNLCDIESCTYNIFGMKINEFALFPIAILSCITILLHILIIWVKHLEKSIKKEEKQLGVGE